jgi:hypothetical protein
VEQKTNNLEKYRCSKKGVLNCVDRILVKSPRNCHFHSPGKSVNCIAFLEGILAIYVKNHENTMFIEVPHLEMHPK